MVKSERMIFMRIIQLFTGSDKTIRAAKEIKEAGVEKAASETLKLNKLTRHIEKSTTYDIARAMGVIK